MSNRTVNYLLLVFVMLLTVATLPWWSKYLDRVISPKKNQDPLGLAGFTQQSVSLISIKQGDDEKILKADGGSWKINDLEADPQEIGRFFDALHGITVTSIASKNPVNHERYDATEENGYSLVLKQNGTETRFIIGTSGPTFNSFYIKKKDNEKLYLVQGSLRSKLTQGVAAWKKKEPTATPKDESK